MKNHQNIKHSKKNVFLNTEEIETNEKYFN